MSIDDKDAENRGDSSAFRLFSTPENDLLRRVNEYFEALPSLTVHFECIQWCPQGRVYAAPHPLGLPGHAYMRIYHANS